MRNRCIKCLAPLSEGEFVVNKDMAYCLDCSNLLHLGESKESRMFQDFQDGAEAAGSPTGDLAGVALEEGAPIEG